MTASALSIRKSICFVNMSRLLETFNNKSSSGSGAFSDGRRTPIAIVRPAVDQVLRAADCRSNSRALASPANSMSGTSCSTTCCDFNRSDQDSRAGESGAERMEQHLKQLNEQLDRSGLRSRRRTRVPNAHTIPDPIRRKRPTGGAVELTAPCYHGRGSCSNFSSDNEMLLPSRA